MSTKIAKMHLKDSGPNPQPKKKNAYHPYQEKIRVIQHNLMFVTGIPNQIANQELLSTDLYFGRYGKIKKVIINNPKKAQNTQAYVTYNSDLEASVAIVALDGLTLQSRPLKASYGTTKYCTHFLKNYQCLNEECFYLHHFEKENEVLMKNDRKSSFDDKNEDALNMVCSEIQPIIQKAVENGEDQMNPNEGFPSVMQMIEFLIESKIVNRSLVSSLTKKYKLKYQQTTSCKQSTSYSLSTTASLLREPQIEKQEEKQLVKQHSKQSQAQKIDEKMSKKQVQQKYIQQSMEIETHRDGLVQNLVERLLVKEIWNQRKGKNNRSRLEFCQQYQKQDNNKTQLRKLKSIIQKHLIASH